MNRATFPLPNLARRFDITREEVYNGIGFAILRGLEVDSFSTDDLSTILKGVSSYVAPLVGIQGQSGCVLGMRAMLRQLEHLLTESKHLGHLISQERVESDHDLVSFLIDCRRRSTLIFI